MAVCIDTPTYNVITGNVSGATQLMDSLAEPKESVNSVVTRNTTSITWKSWLIRSAECDT